MNQIAEQKQAIRQHCLKTRRALKPQHRQQFSQAVIEHIMASHLWQQAQEVGIYLAVNAEVDIKALPHNEKKLYVPATRHQDMQFHRYDNNTELITGPYQIKQPAFSPTHQKPILDLCLMPLTAFDRNGHRLGMGGGFYDRYFAENQHTILAGVAYSIQEYPQLPVEDWDVKLQHVFTEEGHITL